MRSRLATGPSSLYAEMSASGFALARAPARTFARFSPHQLKESFTLGVSERTASEEARTRAEAEAVATAIEAEKEKARITARDLARIEQREEERNAEDFARAAQIKAKGQTLQKQTFRKRVNEMDVQVICFFFLKFVTESLTCKMPFFNEYYSCRSRWFFVLEC